MSSVIRQSTARFARSFQAVPKSRAFMNSSMRSLKEGDKESPEYEKHKEDQLQKQKDGMGHWKSELASNSEEAVQADRESKSKNESIDELQKRTASQAEEKHKHGTSQHSGH